MDTLRTERIEASQQFDAAERLLQALEVMRDGFALKRSNLRRQHPVESDEHIEARLTIWMAGG